MVGGFCFVLGGLVCLSGYGPSLVRLLAPVLQRWKPCYFSRVANGRPKEQQNGWTTLFEGNDMHHMLHVRTGRSARLWHLDKVSVSREKQVGLS